MRFVRPVKAVALDVDGTLYEQNMLRAFMALELGTLPLVQCSYRSAAVIWKIALTFRRVREELRGLGSPTASLAELQYSQTAKQINIDAGTVERTIEEWIFERPLKYLKLCRRRGVNSCFAWLEERNVPIGVFSDYPVREKLRALGISARIAPALCATDPEINAFKPHPKGFLRLCEIWGVPPDEVLYVGDRHEIDAVGAAAAGVPCAILGRKAGLKGQTAFGRCFAISSFKELHHVLVNNLRH